MNKHHISLELNKVLALLTQYTSCEDARYMAEHLELYHDGKIAFCLIPLEVEHSCGVEEDDMEAVANFARNVEGVEFAVTLRTEFTGATKVSVRCAPGYNASAVCAAVGGGGHAAAAGARMDCSQSESKERILEILKEQGYM